MSYFGFLKIESPSYRCQETENFWEASHRQREHNYSHTTGTQLSHESNFSTALDKQLEEQSTRGIKQTTVSNVFQDTTHEKKFVPPLAKPQASVPIQQGPKLANCTNLLSKYLVPNGYGQVSRDEAYFSVCLTLLRELAPSAVSSYHSIFTSLTLKNTPNNSPRHALIELHENSLLCEDIMKVIDEFALRACGASRSGLDQSIWTPCQSEGATAITAEKLLASTELSLKEFAAVGAFQGLAGTNSHSPQSTTTRARDYAVLNNSESEDSSIVSLPQSLSKGISAVTIHSGNPPTEKNLISETTQIKQTKAEGASFELLSKLSNNLSNLEGNLVACVHMENGRNFVLHISKPS